MKQNQNSGWRLVAVTLSLTTFLIALTVFQSAIALGVNQPATALEPPFAFKDEAPSTTRQQFPPVSAGASVLLTETFDSSFTILDNSMPSATGWRVFTDTGSADAAYWGRVIPALSTTYSDTVWSACGVCDGSGLDPDTDDYPADVGTWLIYGPVDLTKYARVEVNFDYLLDANPTIDGSGKGDYFAIGVSDDGTNFSGTQLTGDLSAAGWLSGTHNLSHYAGQSDIYIGFFFHSNGDANLGLGTLLDNVRLRADPLDFAYLPYTVNNFSVSGPLPVFIFNYTFDSGLAGDDPDFKEWGGAYSKANGVISYEQGLIGGRSGDGLYLYNTQFNLTTFAGPNKIAPTNFEISVDLHVTKGKDAARYGIIFGAASKTFGRNGNTPTFDAESTYYKLGLRFPDANASIDNTPAFYQLERCNGTSFSCTKLIEKAPLPGGLAAGVWDTLTVRRQGSSITVLVNGTELQTVSDGTYTGALEFGIFIQSAGANNTTNPLEIIIDNYIVSQLP